MLRQLSYRVNLRVIAEQQLEEAPAVCGSTTEVCSKLSKSSSLKVARLLRSENIPEYLPAGWLSCVDEDPDAKMSKRENIFGSGVLIFRQQCHCRNSRKLPDHGSHTRTALNPVTRDRDKNRTGSSFPEISQHFLKRFP